VIVGCDFVIADRGVRWRRARSLPANTCRRAR
jgi:hypothetical protein